MPEKGWGSREGNKGEGERQRALKQNVEMREARAVMGLDSPPLVPTVGKKK